MGNLLTKKDNRGVTASDSYDPLNRLTAKAFSGGTATPPAYYCYDGAYNTAENPICNSAPAPAFSVGRLTEAYNSNSTTQYTSFDALGRVLAHSQITNGNTYNFAYNYNLAGQLTCEQYPSGRIVVTAYDLANRVSQVAAASTCPAAGTSPSLGMPAYVTGSGGSGIQYAPHGVPSFYFYGNNPARSVTFNGRLQMTGFVEDLGNSTADQFLNVGLNWYPQNGAASANNGNLQWAAYYNGGAAANNRGINYSSFLTFSQTYTYDAVNRLSSVVDNNPNCTTAASATNTVCYSRSFGYDNFGNMYISGAAGIAAAGNAPQASGLYNGNNQLTSGSYDAAGNQTSVNGNTVGYDAESRQISVAGAGVNESYLYDGDGRRVEKAAGGTAQTVFVYDALGRLAAEYSASAYTTPCVTCYLSPDHLGTTRMVTSQDAMVVARHDYLPFGEEIGANVAGRNSQWGPGNDSVNQKFTGKERDSESGLDYFGARYYGGALGRFTSPDWSAKPQAVPYVDLADPQSLNLYSYVRNNPLGKVDSDGHCSAPSGLKSGQVGVCIDTYIQARTVPVAVPGAGLAFGDGRGPASNNKNATYRQEIQLVMTPGGKPQMVKNDGGGSIAESFGVVVYGKGQSNTTVSDPTTDKNGTEHFNVSSTGLNGLASVPFAPTDTIKTSLNFSVTADGKVGLDAGGTRTAYPSIEVYSYGSDGSTRSLLQRTESGNIDDLKRQNQPIPAVSPQ